MTERLFYATELTEWERQGGGRYIMDYAYILRLLGEYPERWRAISIAMLTEEDQKWLQKWRGTTLEGYSYRAPVNIGDWRPMLREEMLVIHVEYKLGREQFDQ